MSQTEGTFITIEGIDGSGKTMVVETISDEFDVYTTSEPSEYWTGEQVRRALRADTPPFTDLFLFLADRHYHIEEFIKPHIEQGDVVVSDRYADSTRAYQPVQLESEGADLTWIENVMAPWGYKPDLTIYLDVSVETGLERCDEEEKYETVEMLEQVKENYESWIGPDGPDPDDRFIVIDAEQSKEQVRAEVLGAVSGVIKR